MAAARLNESLSPPLSSSPGSALPPCFAAIVVLAPIASLVIFVPSGSVIVSRHFTACSRQGDSTGSQFSGPNTSSSRFAAVRAVMYRAPSCLRTLTSPPNSAARAAKTSGYLVPMR